MNQPKMANISMENNTNYKNDKNYREVIDDTMNKETPGNNCGTQFVQVHNSEQELKNDNDKMRRKSYKNDMDIGDAKKDKEARKQRLHLKSHPKQTAKEEIRELCLETCHSVSPTGSVKTVHDEESNDCDREDKDGLESKDFDLAGYKKKQTHDCSTENLAKFRCKDEPVSFLKNSGNPTNPPKPKSYSHTAGKDSTRHSARSSPAKSSEMHKKYKPTSRNKSFNNKEPRRRHRSPKRVSKDRTPEVYDCRDRKKSPHGDSWRKQRRRDEDRLDPRACWCRECTSPRSRSNEPSGNSRREPPTRRSCSYKSHNKDSSHKRYRTTHCHKNRNETDSDDCDEIDYRRNRQKMGCPCDAIDYVRYHDTGERYSDSRHLLLRQSHSRHCPEDSDRCAHHLFHPNDMMSTSMQTIRDNICHCDCDISKPFPEANLLQSKAHPKNERVQICKDNNCTHLNTTNEYLPLKKASSIEHDSRSHFPLSVASSQFYQTSNRKNSPIGIACQIQIPTRIYKVPREIDLSLNLIHIYENLPRAVVDNCCPNDPRVARYQRSQSQCVGGKENVCLTAVDISMSAEKKESSQETKDAFQCLDTCPPKADVECVDDIKPQVHGSCILSDTSLETCKTNLSESKPNQQEQLLTVSKKAILDVLYSFCMIKRPLSPLLTESSDSEEEPDSFKVSGGNETGDQSVARKGALQEVTTEHSKMHIHKTAGTVTYMETETCNTVNHNVSQIDCSSNNPHGNIKTGTESEEIELYGSDNDLPSFEQDEINTPVLLNASDRVYHISSNLATEPNCTGIINSIKSEKIECGSNGLPFELEAKYDYGRVFFDLQPRCQHSQSASRGTEEGNLVCFTPSSVTDRGQSGAQDLLGRAMYNAGMSDNVLDALLHTNKAVEQSFCEDELFSEESKDKKNDLVSYDSFFSDECLPQGTNTVFGSEINRHEKIEWSQPIAGTSSSCYHGPEGVLSLPNESTKPSELEIEVHALLAENSRLVDNYHALFEQGTGNNTGQTEQELFTCDEAYPCSTTWKDLNLLPGTDFGEWESTLSSEMQMQMKTPNVQIDWGSLDFLHEVDSKDKCDLPLEDCSKDNEVLLQNPQSNEPYRALVATIIAREAEDGRNNVEDINAKHAMAPQACEEPWKCRLRGGTHGDVRNRHSHTGGDKKKDTEPIKLVARLIQTNVTTDLENVDKMCKIKRRLQQTKRDDVGKSDATSTKTYPLNDCVMTNNKNKRLRVKKHGENSEVERSPAEYSSHFHFDSGSSADVSDQANKKIRTLLNQGVNTNEQELYTNSTCDSNPTHISSPRKKQNRRKQKRKNRKQGVRKSSLSKESKSLKIAGMPEFTQPDSDTPSMRKTEPTCVCHKKQETRRSERLKTRTSCLLENTEHILNNPETSFNQAFSLGDSSPMGITLIKTLRSAKRKGEVSANELHLQARTKEQQDEILGKMDGLENYTASTKTNLNKKAVQVTDSLSSTEAEFQNEKRNTRNRQKGLQMSVSKTKMPASPKVHLTPMADAHCNQAVSRAMGLSFHQQRPSQSIAQLDNEDGHRDNVTRSSDKTKTRAKKRLPQDKGFKSQKKTNVGNKTQYHNRRSGRKLPCQKKRGRASDQSNNDISSSETSLQEEESGRKRRASTRTSSVGPHEIESETVISMMDEFDDMRKCLEQDLDEVSTFSAQLFDMFPNWSATRGPLRSVVHVMDTPKPRNYKLIRRRRGQPNIHFCPGLTPHAVSQGSCCNNNADSEDTQDKPARPSQAEEKAAKRALRQKDKELTQYYNRRQKRPENSVFVDSMIKTSCSLKQDTTTNNSKRSNTTQSSLLTSTTTTPSMPFPPPTEGSLFVASTTEDTNLKPCVVDFVNRMRTHYGDFISNPDVTSKESRRVLCDRYLLSHGINPTTSSTYGQAQDKTGLKSRNVVSGLPPRPRANSYCSSSRSLISNISKQTEESDSKSETSISLKSSESSVLGGDLARIALSSDEGKLGPDSENHEAPKPYSLYLPKIQEKRDSHELSDRHSFAKVAAFLKLDQSQDDGTSNGLKDVDSHQDIPIPPRVAHPEASPTTTVFSGTANKTTALPPIVKENTEQSETSLYAHTNIDPHIPHEKSRQLTKQQLPYSTTYTNKETLSFKPKHFATSSRPDVYSNQLNVTASSKIIDDPRSQQSVSSDSLIPQQNRSPYVSPVEKEESRILQEQISKCRSHEIDGELAVSWSCPDVCGGGRKTANLHNNTLDTKKRDMSDRETSWDADRTHLAGEEASKETMNVVTSGKLLADGGAGEPNMNLDLCDKHSAREIEEAAKSESSLKVERNEIFIKTENELAYACASRNADIEGDACSQEEKNESQWISTKLDLGYAIADDERPKDHRATDDAVGNHIETEYDSITEATKEKMGKDLSDKEQADEEGTIRFKSLSSLLKEADTEFYPILKGFSQSDEALELGEDFDVTKMLNSGLYRESSSGFDSCWRKLSPIPEEDDLTDEKILKKED